MYVFNFLQKWLAVALTCHCVAFFRMEKACAFVPLCLQSVLRAIDSSTNLDDDGRICGPLTYYLIS